MVKDYRVPVSKPSLENQDFQEIKKAFDSSWISSKSPWVEKFEKAFAKKISKTKYAASVNSGTSALFLALKSLGVGGGDEVILPSLTMIATINAVTLTGAKPVLVDCQSFEDFNIDIKEVENKITKKTKVIIPVHLYGYSCEMDKLIKLAKDKNIYIVEDAAEAMGAMYKGKALGSFGDLSCFSLYSNKIITTGNGGMVATNNKKLYELIKKLRFFDFNEDSHFTHYIIGYNMVLSGLQAALGLSQTERFGKLLLRRREIFKEYKKYLKRSDEYFIPEPIKYQNPNYWFPAVIFKSLKTKEKVRLYLQKKGIETRVFFKPLHLQPVYKDLFKGERYEKAEYFYKHGLLLPSFHELKKNQIEEISNLIDTII
jgi:perosamine synthetase